MFNVKDILAAVRACVLGALLFAPLTSHALPANDNHVALCDTQVTNAPNTRDEHEASTAGWEALCDSHCLTVCLRVYEDCSAKCGEAKWCVMGCAMTHMGCSMGCNSGSGPG